MSGPRGAMIDTAAAGAGQELSTATGAGWRLGCPQARGLTGRLVELIERGGLSVAAAARRAGVDVEHAGLLVRVCAIERECAQTELEERLDDIQAQCPGEDWWSYTDRQLQMIVSGEAIPNRIVRELVTAWRQRTGHRTAWLAAELAVSAETLRRSLGLVAQSGRRHGTGRHRPRFQRTITVKAAGRIVSAIGIPPCEVPGL